jgi:hypothetical protein
MMTEFGNLERTVGGTVIHLEMMRKLTKVFSQDELSLG